MVVADGEEDARNVYPEQTIHIHVSNGSFPISGEGCRHVTDAGDLLTQSKTCSARTDSAGPVGDDVRDLP